MAASSRVSGSVSVHEPNTSAAICLNSAAPISPHAISVAFDGRYKREWNVLTVSMRQLPQRFLGAERHVRVRMRAVHDLHERAVGDRRRHVANLHEPRQPELPDAIEVGRVEPRTHHAIGKQRQRRPRELRERRHA